MSARLEELKHKVRAYDTLSGHLRTLYGLSNQVYQTWRAQGRVGVIYKMVAAVSYLTKLTHTDSIVLVVTPEYGFAASLVSSAVSGTSNIIAACNTLLAMVLGKRGSRQLQARLLDMTQQVYAVQRLTGLNLGWQSYALLYPIYRQPETAAAQLIYVFSGVAAGDEHIPLYAVPAYNEVSDLSEYLELAVFSTVVQESRMAEYLVRSQVCNRGATRLTELVAELTKEVRDVRQQEATAPLLTLVNASLIR